MKNPRLTRLLWLVAALALSISCTIGSTATPTQAPIVIQPTAISQPTAIPPTAIPPTAVPSTDTPAPTPTKGPVIIDDDFSADNGRFKCDSCVVEGGQLTVGPFAYVDSYEPFTAICSDCGTVTNYKMSVDIWFVDGNTTFGFGLLLRDSKDGLDLFMTSTTWQVYNVFSFDPKAGGGAGWDSLIGGWKQGPMKPSRGVNTFEALVKDSKLTVTINGDLLRTVDLPKGSGQVGMYVSNFQVGAGFDNFHFEELP